MLKLRRYPLAVTASVVAMAAGPAAILGLPFGVWALVVLNRREVRDAFAGRSSRRGEAPSDFSPKAVQTAPPRTTPSLIAAPAIAIMVVSAINAVQWLFGAGMLVLASVVIPLIGGGSFRFNFPRWTAALPHSLTGQPAVTLGIILVGTWMLLWFAMIMVSLLGGRQMHQMRSHGLALAGASCLLALGLLGLVMNPVFSMSSLWSLIETGIGTWAFAVLLRSGVKAEFGAVESQRTRERHAAPPTTTEQANHELARRRVAVPAVGLKIASGLSLLVLGALLTTLFFGVSWQSTGGTETLKLKIPGFSYESTTSPGDQSRPWWLTFGPPLLLAWMCLPALTFWGAWRMRQLRHRGLAVWGALLGMVTPPGLVLGFVFGLWAFVVLLRRQVREAFQLNARSSGHESAPSEPPLYPQGQSGLTSAATGKRSRFAPVAIGCAALGVAGLVVVGLLAGGFFFLRARKVEAYEQQAATAQRSELAAQAAALARVESAPGWKDHRRINQPLRLGVTGQGSYGGDDLRYEVHADQQSVSLTVSYAAVEGMEQRVQIDERGKRRELGGNGKTVTTHVRDGKQVVEEKAMLPRAEFDRITAFVLQQRKSAERQGATTNLTFGPVVERTINHLSVGSNTFIRFQTGELFDAPPEAAVAARDASGWAQAQGMDAAVGIISSNLLMGFNVVAIPAPAVCWDNLSPTQAVRRLETETRSSSHILSHGQPRSFPDTVLFQTREDGIGLLQVFQLVSNPPGLKVRYKFLAQPPVLPRVPFDPEAAPESWAPVLLPGEPPDLAKLLTEAKELTGKSRYAEALARFVWYHSQAQEYGESFHTMQRRLTGISDWVELGRRYPRASEKLLEIRDAKTREIQAGRGHSDLLLDVVSINSHLKQDAATVELLKNTYAQDPELVQQCYYHIESILVAQGEYEFCFKLMGDPQRRFDLMRNSWETQKRLAPLSMLELPQRPLRNTQNLSTTNPAATNDSALARMLPPSPALPGRAQQADDYFIKQLCQLVEILVGVGRKAEAERIQIAALALLDSPALQTAVRDAEERAQERRRNQLSPGPVVEQVQVDMNWSGAWTQSNAPVQFRWVAAEGDTNSPADLLPDPADASGTRKLRVRREVVLSSLDVDSAGFTKYQSDEKELAVFLNARGGEKFARLTRENIGRQLAIVWRGRVLAAPIIRSEIPGRRVSITGRFTDAEAQQLLDVLNHRDGMPIPPAKPVPPRPPAPPVVTGDLQARLKATEKISSFMERDELLTAIAADAAKAGDAATTRAAVGKMTSFMSRDEAITKTARLLVAAGRRAEALELAGQATSFMTRDALIKELAK